MTNSDWFARAQARIPGGVNSPVRAFGAVGGEPFFVARARGSRIVDTDGRDYLDYVQSWGASILGHAHPKVVEAVQRAAADGTSYGAPTPREVELVEAICARVPSVEKARLVSSGTEAAMTAVRLARDAPRCAARLRRGHHRLSRRPRWRASALRRHARPLDLRQGDRRRPAARGRRRAGRGDGRARAHRPRVPGGHALREPARDRRRA